MIRKAIATTWLGLAFCGLSVQQAGAESGDCLTGNFDEPHRGALACMKELEPLTITDPTFMLMLVKMAGYHKAAGHPDKVLTHYHANKIPELSESKRLSFEAVVHLSLDDRDRAREVSKKAARLDPNNVDAWYMLGSLQLDADDHAAALKSLFKALKADPDHVPTLKRRTLLFAQLGKITRAIGDVNRALNLVPEDTQLYDMRAELLLRRGQSASDDFNRALDDFNTILRFEPDNHKIHNRRGAILFRQGRTPDALRHVMKAVELDPNNAKYRTNTAIVLNSFARKGRRMGSRIGDPAEAALDQIIHAIAIEPTGHRFSVKGTSHLLAGQPVEAFNAFDQSAQLDEIYALRYHTNLQGRAFFQGAVDAPWDDTSRRALMACINAGCDPLRKPPPKKGQGT